MSKRIQEDVDEFESIISGRKRKELRKFIKNGSIFRRRGKNGKISITIPNLELPRIVFGQPQDGYGVGPGKPGDVIKPAKGGDGKGGASNDPGEGITIQVDLEEILDLLKDELELPDLQPKPSQVMQDEKIKYNDISRVGPDSLRHMRKTFQQTLKRCCAAGTADKFQILPGFTDPVRVITPISSDERFRQYKVVTEPSSNAVIFFARDWSGSMDLYKCDVVSDMFWWIELFISRHYKRVESVYVGHDTQAVEVDQNKFYNYRYGGGTNCSSAFQYISRQLENRFPANSWNIYVLYATDGDNYESDNPKLVETLRTSFKNSVVNLVGITQIMSYRYEHSVKWIIDREIEEGSIIGDHVKTTHIGRHADPNDQFNWNGMKPLSDEERDQQIKRAIKDILGTKIKA